MKTEDVPKPIRDRVAQVNGARASIGNTFPGNGAMRPLSDLRNLAAQLFGIRPEPKAKRAKATATTTPAPATKRAQVTTEEQVYARMYGAQTTDAGPKLTAAEQAVWDKLHADPTPAGTTDERTLWQRIYGR